MSIVPPLNRLLFNIRYSAAATCCRRRSRIDGTFYGGCGSLPGCRRARNAAALPKSVIYISFPGVWKHDSFDLSRKHPIPFGGISADRDEEPRVRFASICRDWRSGAINGVGPLVEPAYKRAFEGHHIMLTGGAKCRAGSTETRRSDRFPLHRVNCRRHYPGRNALPAAAVVPFNFIHASGRIIPGQFAGEMGERYDPWWSVRLKTVRVTSVPELHGFRTSSDEAHGDPVFQAPICACGRNLSRPFGFRRSLLDMVEQQQRT